jgi:hypothetical protein
MGNPFVQPPDLTRYRPKPPPPLLSAPREVRIPADAAAYLRVLETLSQPDQRQGRHWGESFSAWGGVLEERRRQERSAAARRRPPQRGSYTYALRRRPAYPYTIVDRLLRCPQPLDPNPGLDLTDDQVLAVHPSVWEHRQQQRRMYPAPRLNRKWMARHTPEYEEAFRQAIPGILRRSAPVWLAAGIAGVGLVWLVTHPQLVARLMAAPPA